MCGDGLAPAVIHASSSVLAHRLQPLCTAKCAHASDPGRPSAWFSFLGHHSLCSISSDTRFERISIGSVQGWTTSV